MPALEPYPWRWTTVVVCFAGGLVLVGLGLFNFAAVGYNQQSSYRDVFESNSGVGWKNKLKPGYAQRQSVTCNPNSLVVGGIYRTNNAIFALSAESLRDPSNGAPLGSANYSGDALDSCRVDRIYMMAEFPTHDVKWRAKVACRTPRLYVNFTVDSIVTLRAGVTNGIINVDTLGTIENEQNRPEAIVTSVLYALGLDVLAGLFFKAPPVPSSALTTNSSASTLWAEWDPLVANGTQPMVVSGITSPDGAYWIRPGSGAFSELLPPSRRALENYAIALHDAILVDVGSTVYLGTSRANDNIFTNATALRTRIQTFDLLQTFMTPTNGSANSLNFSIPVAPFLLSHTSEFRLPIAARRLDDEQGAARLVQRYLCHSMVLKPPATLVVDVMVATVSMFMVAWGIAQIGLMYVAKVHSSNGNHCICPTCDPYANRLIPPTPGDGTTPGEKDRGGAEYVELLQHPTIFTNHDYAVAAQSSSEPVETVTEPEPEPTPTESIDPTTTVPGPTITPGPDTTIPSETSTAGIIVSTAIPPVGGGATCVQTCLVRAAAGAGCQSSTDLACVCSGENYLGLAQICFSEFSCQASAVSEAEGDYNGICRIGNDSSSSLATSSSSRSNSPVSSRMVTSRAVIIISGAVITVSGSASTIMSGFTTIQTGDTSPTGVPGGTLPGASSNSALNLQSNAVAGLGIIGGAAILLL
ncbi:CFEM domain protein [Ceratobasidium sp. AG-Ba]|nr:CFEM domain protein [Ceratobasidium sp. AG-Ba]